MQRSRRPKKVGMLELFFCLKAKLPTDAGLVLFLHSSKFALEESVDFSPIEREAGINPINTTLPDYDTVPTLFAPTFSRSSPTPYCIHPMLLHTHCVFALCLVSLLGFNFFLLLFVVSHSECIGKCFLNSNTIHEFVLRQHQNAESIGKIE